MIICIDFDGTIVEHKYPLIGKDVPYAIDTIRELQETHSIILYTMRSDDTLASAIRYLKIAGIDPWGINVNPDQANWTNSPKIYGQLYIDDAALGCPLIHPGNGERPFVDWIKVRVLLKERKIL